MIASYLEQAGLSSQQSSLVASFFHRRELKKNELFVREGRTSKEIAYIEKGIMQYFSITNEGEERTTYVSLQGGFVASLLSYLSEVPARENIRAISDCVIWTIQKNDFSKLQQEIPALRDFYVGLIEWQICCIDKGKFDLITLTAEQRYEKLLKEEPELLQQVPLQYIASMMGITPRHLSRLRGKT